MKTVQSTNYPPTALCLIAATIAAPQLALCDTTVSKVSLTVLTGGSKVPTRGALYKISLDERSHVADVGPDGKVSRQVSCVDGEQFEAEAESYLARPVAPVRRSCDETMAFSFKRVVLVTWDNTGSNPELDPAAGPVVYSNYATIFAQKGQIPAYNAWSDAAVASTATQALGDKKLDMFVIRDPQQNYRLVLNSKGVSALKEKQKSWGIEPTGQIDFATQLAIAKSSSAGSSTTSPRSVGRLKCVMKEEEVVCGAPGSIEAMGKDSVANLREWKW
ncbi:MAG TPA: hypothetical protein VGI48_02335 [Caldimonas sp.]|jgi:hypothetical protein